MKDSNDRRSPIKDKPFKYPGQYLDKEIEIFQLKRFRNLSIFLVVLAVAVYEILHAYYGVPPQPILATILVLASGIYCYYADSQLRGKIKSYEQGSEGEKIVGDILDSLKKDGARVFHDVVIDGADYNIDHVILSKHGIFIVETKTISKPTKGNPKISSNGKTVFGFGKPNTEHIDQAVYNSRSLRSYLNKRSERQFRVHPVLVYPRWFVEAYADSRIWVLNPKVLQYHINREPETISETDYAVAELCLSDIARS